MLSAQQDYEKQELSRWDRASKKTGGLLLGTHGAGLNPSRNGADIASAHPGSVLGLGLLQQFRGFKQVDDRSSHHAAGLQGGGMGQRCLALSHQLPGVAGVPEA